MPTSSTTPPDDRQPLPRDDAEPTEPDPFSPGEFGAWRGFIRLHRTVFAELERRLEREHRLSLLAYGVLITLVTAPGRRLRMSDLALQVNVSPSGLTRLVGRMAEEGLVERDVDPHDGRSFHARLTPAGLEHLREAQTTHHAVVRALYLGRLSDAEHRRLARLYERALPGVVSSDVWPPASSVRAGQADTGRSRR